MGLLWILLIVFVLAPLAGAVAYRIREQYAGPDVTAPEAAAPAEELRRLEERVDRLGRQVDRIAEDQEFLVRLLEEKGSEGSASGGSEGSRRLDRPDQERTSVS